MTFKAKFVIVALTLTVVAVVLRQSWLNVNRPLGHAEMKAAIKSQAEQMADAMGKEDLQAWADWILPTVIDQAGGREKWIERMKALLQANEQANAKMGFVKVAEATSIAERESVHYATIVYEYEVTIRNITRVQKSVLIGVSTDGGRNWKFAEGSYNRNRVMAVVPDLPDEIRLPTREELERPRITRHDPIARKRPKAPPNDENKPLASEELNVRLKTQAQEMFDAVVKGDFKTLEARILPEAIEKHGGRDNWLNGIKETLKLRQNLGVKTDSVRAGEITATKSGHPECYGVIAYELASTFEGKQEVHKGSLVGASTDGGRNWTFIVGGGYAIIPGLSRYDVSELIPDWPKDLPIPD